MVLKETKILKISSKNFKEVVKEIIKFIKKGKILVLPTDTVYGLITAATNKKAVEKLFKIKKRTFGKPIPIFVKNIKAAKEIVFIDKDQEKFLKKVWPGRVTVVLKKKKKIKIFGVKSETIGLRIPKYRLINTLFKKINLPLTGTSANLSGTPASGNIKEVLIQFKDQKYQPDLIIDAGNLPKRKPSKIIDLTVLPPKILRH